jgi:hypothetical protein
MTKTSLQIVAKDYKSEGDTKSLTGYTWAAHPFIFVIIFVKLLLSVIFGGSPGSIKCL